MTSEAQLGAAKVIDCIQEGSSAFLFHTKNLGDATYLAKKSYCACISNYHRKKCCQVLPSAAKPLNSICDIFKLLVEG